MSEHGRTTILPGNDADARGRNGVFRPAYIEVRPLGSESECDVEITASSKRTADIPPLGLRLNVEDAELLAKAVRAAVNEIYRQRAARYVADFMANDAARREAEIAAAKGAA